MSKPKAMDVAVQMVKYAEQVPVIPYSQYDCYNIVKRAVEAQGGSMRYSGTNDLFRNGVTSRMPLGDAIAKGLLKAGWAVFIVEAESASTPAKYRGDGYNDANHMGIYTDMTNQETGAYCEIVHSSQTREGVYPSTLQNAWNWAAELVDVDYSDWHAEGASDFSDVTGTETVTTTLTQTAPGPGQAMVNTADTGLILRKQPQKVKGNEIKEMPKGTIVQVLSQFGEWTQVRFMNYDGVKHEGWCVSSYLLFGS